MSPTTWPDAVVIVGVHFAWLGALVGLAWAYAYGRRW